MKFTTSKALGEIDLEETQDDQEDSEIYDELLRDVAAFSSDEELDVVAPLEIESGLGKKTVTINKSFATIKSVSVVNGIQKVVSRNISVTELKLSKR